uniref:P0 suppressor of RNA silencing n=1 Tax=Green Sichuan pepper enamovirus TaxID=2802551 RepID=A0A8F3EVE7_9VIRU|nr:P0 suppressor of RNA silencing [Green Sichuan pepper enamovirus]
MLTECNLVAAGEIVVNAPIYLYFGSRAHFTIALSCLVSAVRNHVEADRCPPTCHFPFWVMANILVLCLSHSKSRLKRDGMEYEGFSTYLMEPDELLMCFRYFGALGIVPRTPRAQGPAYILDTSSMCGMANFGDRLMVATGQCQYVFEPTPGGPDIRTWHANEFPGVLSHLYGRTPRDYVDELLRGATGVYRDQYWHIRTPLEVLRACRYLYIVAAAEGPTAYDSDVGGDFMSVFLGRWNPPLQILPEAPDESDTDSWGELQINSPPSEDGDNSDHELDPHALIAALEGLELEAPGNLGG